MFETLITPGSSDFRPLVHTETSSRFKACVYESELKSLQCQKQHQFKIKTTKRFEITSMASKSSARDCRWNDGGSLPLSDRIETIICPQTSSVNERLTSGVGSLTRETKLNFKANFTFSRSKVVLSRCRSGVYTI